MWILNSEKILPNCLVEKLHGFTLPPANGILESLLFQNSMDIPQKHSSLAGPGFFFLRYLWHWVSVLHKCWQSENRIVKTSFRMGPQTVFLYSFNFFLLQICGTVTSLANHVSYATRALKKTGWLRGPPAALSFPGLSLTLRMELLVCAHPCLSSHEQPQATLLCRLLSTPTPISTFSNPPYPSKPCPDTRTLPTRKGPTQILNFWGSLLEPHLGALRIFNLDKEYKPVLTEKVSPPAS